MRNNTKTVGDLGELCVAAKLASFGYFVSKPLTDNAPYDLIVDINGELKKVQVKARSISNSTLEVKLETVVNKKHVPYNENDFDILAIYCVDSGEIALIGKDKLSGKKSIKFRMIPPKAKTATVWMFSDYVV